jgi:hypothetical protein
VKQARERKAYILELPKTLVDEWFVLDWIKSILHFTFPISISSDNGHAMVIDR